jgi:hypothetical protein
VDDEMNEKESINLFEREMQKSGRVQEWQLYVAILSLVLAVFTFAIQNLNVVMNESLVSLIIVVLIIVSILSISFKLYTSTSETESGSWYGRINALENLRRSALIKDEPLRSTMLDLYITGLRKNYQYALLEGRKDLGEYLKEQMTEHERNLEKE